MEQTRVISLRFNRVYKPVFTTAARYIDIWGGRARGGSHFATAYFLFLITQPHYFRGVFLRAILGDIKDSLYKDFKDRVQEAADEGQVALADFAFNNNDYTCTYLPTGNSIISKGFRKSSSTQSAKLKSIAGCTHAIIEECEEVGEEDFNQFDDSLRTGKVAQIQILRLFNPPSKNHWLIRRYYQLMPSGADGWYTATPRPMPELLSIHSTYRDNVKNLNASTIKNYHAYGDAGSALYNPDLYYRNVCGLISDGKKGRIFTRAMPLDYKVFRELPYPSFYGLDFGFNDPVALVECKYHNNRLFVHELIYQPGLDNDELAARMRQAGITRQKTIYADSAEPKSIKTLQKKGFMVIAAEKGADSINYGIRELQSTELYATTTSKNLWLELEEYSWALDAHHQPIDEPIDDHNHLIDGMRYAYTMHIKRRSKLHVGTGSPTHANDAITYDNEPVMPEEGDALDDDDVAEFYR